MAPPPPLASQSSSRGRGCLFYGCASVVVLLFLLVISIPIGIHFGSKYLVGQVTSHKPLEFPPLRLSPSAARDVADQLQAYLTNSPPQPAPFEITEDQLNALISIAPEWNNRARVRCLQDELELATSLPTSGLPIPWFGRYLSNRFFNCTARFRLEPQPPTWKLQLTRLSLGDHTIPATLKADLQVKLNEVTADALKPLEGALKETTRWEITPGKIKLWRVPASNH